MLYRKYKNRKIYCVTESCYVTLGDIGTDVLNGVTPTIVCCNTKRDITAEVLSEVVALKRKRYTPSVDSLITELRTLASA